MEENYRLNSDMQKFTSDFEAKFTDLKLLLKELEKHKVYLDDLSTKSSNTDNNAKTSSDQDIASLQAQLALVQKENEKLATLVQGLLDKHNENLREIRKRNDILFKLDELASKAHKQVPANKYLDKVVSILNQIRAASVAHANQESASKEGHGGSHGTNGSSGSSGRSTEHSYIQVTRDGATSPSSPGRGPSSTSSGAANPSLSAAGVASGMNLSGIRKPLNVPKHPSTATLMDALNRSSTLPPPGHNPPVKPTPLHSR
ncbi:hypothetical protein EON65_22990 [archaeon]|nr:MAG: hypothetical protein EON65_22990 [archaeon]